jgi:superfamily II DNA/RNA helicase
VKEKKTEETTVQRTPSTLQNYYIVADSDEKFNQLMDFLQCHKEEKVMIFFSTCAGLDSSTTKTGCHDIAEILLKMALNTKNQSK